MSIDDMMRSTDVTLHVVIIVLLIAFVLGTWYFYGTLGPTVNNTDIGASTVTSPMSPNAGPTRPAPSPNPGP